MSKVIVFTSDTCPHCITAKNYLKEKGIEFEERNVKETENRKKLISMGFMGVPVILIDDEAVSGFDQNKIDSLLGL
ncbi:glutaredoxin family protein [Hathewaya limosa]|uniref:Glutaredoxin n=1 Tax=Hathewaya limosa TaxID=1536 RepID=A0ABU0JQL5_HATLI|nr:NrdH-redoxin [Clostridiaceae bacterium 14S0207]MDQ0479388.1 glutaredoxin [Hathewaya limosa]